MTATFAAVHHFKGATVEQYENVLRLVHPDEGKGLPAGQLYHAAGATEGGFVVIAIWDSEASWVTFRDETLLPGFAAVKNGPPEPPTETAVQLHNVVSA
jgi:hypothetical protein